MDRMMKPIRNRLIEEDATHLRSALAVMHREADDGWAVVAVEEPFVLDLGPDLPRGADAEAGETPDRVDKRNLRRILATGDIFL